MLAWQSKTVLTKQCQSKPVNQRQYTKSQESKGQSKAVVTQQCLCKPEPTYQGPGKHNTINGSVNNSAGVKHGQYTKSQVSTTQWKAELTQQCFSKPEATYQVPGTHKAIKGSITTTVWQNFLQYNSYILLSPASTESQTIQANVHKNDTLNIMGNSWAICVEHFTLIFGSTNHGTKGGSTKQAKITIILYITLYILLYSILQIYLYLI